MEGPLFLEFYFMVSKAFLEKSGGLTLATSCRICQTHQRGEPGSSKCLCSQRLFSGRQAYFWGQHQARITLQVPLTSTLRFISSHTWWFLLYWYVSGVWSGLALILPLITDLVWLPHPPQPLFLLTLVLVCHFQWCPLCRAQAKANPSSISHLSPSQNAQNS